MLSVTLVAELRCGLGFLGKLQGSAISSHRVLINKSCLKIGYTKNGFLLSVTSPPNRESRPDGSRDIILFTVYGSGNCEKHTEHGMY